MTNADADFSILQCTESKSHKVSFEMQHATLEIEVIVFCKSQYMSSLFQTVQNLFSFWADFKPE